MNSKDNSLCETLQCLGFDSKESVVYVSAFQIGPASAGEIAKEAGFNRVTTYEVLKRLVKRGIASVIQRGGGKEFSVLKPDRLFQLLKTSMDEFQHQLKDLLDSRSKKKTNPTVSFFQGLEGIREVYEEFSTLPGVQVYTITKPQALYDVLGMRYINKLFARRKKYGVKVFSLAPDSPDGVHAKRADILAGRKTRLFPHSKYRIPNEIMVYNNRVALLSIEQLSAVVIENKEIAASMRVVWRMLWDRF